MNIYAKTGRKNKINHVNCKNYKTLKRLLSLLCRGNVGLKIMYKICQLKLQR